MNEISQTVSQFLFFGAVLSLLGYELGLYLKKSFRLAIFNPLLISIAAVMLVLLTLRVDYESYYTSAKYVSYLLTPATVSLAIPLYQQLHLLKKHGKAIAAGVVTGVLTSMTSVLLLSLLFHFTHEQYVTLLPKSITTAIGMGVSEELGGIVTITVASIVVTGILGHMIAEPLCRFLKITEPVAKGIAIGSAAHAIGTTKAMEIGEIEGAMSSLSIAMSGLCTVVLASVFAQFL